MTAEAGSDQRMAVRGEEKVVVRTHPRDHGHEPASDGPVNVGKSLILRDRAAHLRHDIQPSLPEQKAAQIVGMVSAAVPFAAGA